MKKKALMTAVLVFMALTATVAAPQLPADRNVKVGQPAELKRNILKKSDLEKFVKTGKWGQNNVVKNYWNVWSDRSHNFTYNGPSESSGKFSELEFNQAVRIAEIDKGYALVYEEVMKGVNYPVISNQARCLGWIKMDDLLLWEACPTNDLGIYHKALIVANVEGWSKAGNKGYDKCYKNYLTKDGMETVKTDMNFYFVMKEVGDYALLSRTSKLGDGLTDKQLYAWVNNNSYVPWDQRTCLEGNWDPDVADNLKGHKVGVYRDGKLGTDITLGKENGVTKNRATKYRFPKQRLRFPLLNVAGGQYVITAFATPEGPGASFYNEEESDIDEISKVDDVKADLLQKNNVINLIVVIDGTSSMENYYKPMQEAIQQAYTTFGNQNGIKVRAGVVIYRDYADGEYMVETLPLTEPTNPKLKEFMEKGGKYGIKSSPKDRTAAEALYQGLNAALDANHMGYSNKNSNLMFVVGDCGNAVDDDKISQQDLIAKCASLNVNLVAFQVRNKDNAAFNDFRRQMGAILRGNLKVKYKEQIKWNIKPDGIVLKEIENTKLPVMAAMRNADKGEEMSPQKLNSIIKENYIRFEKVIQAREQAIMEGNVTNFEQTDEADGAATNSLYSTFLESILTPEQRNIIVKNGLVTAFKGQTAQKASNGQDYWKPVLFITSDEFAELMEKLKLVYQGASAGTRAAYVAGLKALVRTFMPEITEEEMGRRDVKQVMDLVTGLTVKTNSLSNHTILEIQEEKSVSQEEFEGMVTDFKSKYEYLDHIKSTDYEFSVLRKTSNVRWYWLPIEALP